MSRDAASDPWPWPVTNKCTGQLSLSPPDCNGGSMAITITCIRHTHFNSAQDTLLTANKYGLYVPLWIIFVSLHNNLSLELSQKWPQYLFVPIASQPDRHRTEEGLNVPQLDPWPCLTADRTLLLFILLICFGEIFYCSSSRSTLKVWPITWNGTFTGDCTTRTCVSCSILSQIMRITVNTLNIQKYLTQSSINALCTLHIYMRWVLRARRERLVRYLFYVLLFIQNLFRIVNTNA